MKSKIAAIVVTYNRKELLAICLDAILRQECKPHSVFIIDNASTDGTEALVNELGYNGEKEGIRFIYVKRPENIGGSGGFYSGMKMAFESSEKFDAFWLMDDDGIPDKKQLTYSIINLLLSNKPVKSYDETLNYFKENFSIQVVVSQWSQLLQSNLSFPVSPILPLKNKQYRYKWLKEIIRRVKTHIPILNKNPYTIEDFMHKYEKSFIEWEYRLY